MLMPSIFADDFMDDFFGAPTREGRRREEMLGSLMQTDVQENETGYTVTMNIPGVKKENVKAELKDGYLTVAVSTGTSNEEKEKNGRYIRRERYQGSCSRSFYVGKDITQEDIKAKFEDGTLKLSIPKKEAIPEKKENNYIEIQ
ncbi:MAG: Hsp20/alpha crystallin family protein [Lachnospiraceae bacterium]|nr:Hsp20/alpha crystallin family protein [Lachnospiraceae bacterium]